MSNRRVCSILTGSCAPLGKSAAGAGMPVRQTACKNAWVSIWPPASIYIGSVYHRQHQEHPTKASPPANAAARMDALGPRGRMAAAYRAAGANGPAWRPAVALGSDGGSRRRLRRSLRVSGALADGDPLSPPVAFGGALDRRGQPRWLRPAARSPTVGFSAIPKPLADARGSDRSRDREGAVHGNSTISHGRRPSRNFKPVARVCASFAQWVKSTKASLEEFLDQRGIALADIAVAVFPSERHHAVHPIRGIGPKHVALADSLHEVLKVPVEREARNHRVE
jgi:hypothetical protein